MTELQRTECMHKWVNEWMNELATSPWASVKLFGSPLSSSAYLQVNGWCSFDAWGSPITLKPKVKNDRCNIPINSLVNSALFHQMPPRNCSQSPTFSFPLRYRAAPDNICFSFVLCVISPREVVVPGPGDQTSRLVAIDLTLMKPNMFCWEYW